MQYQIKRYIVLFFLCYGNIVGYSQVYNFRNYNEDSGLPQNYIYKISQNKEGFLLLSTGDGFSTFGGNKFQNFTIKDSLCENFTNTHFEDSRGITWLGHYQSGISILKDYTFSKIKQSDLFGSKVISFAEDKAKNIWFVVQGKGVYYVDTSFTIRNPEFPSDFIPNCISFEPSGGLICGTDEGLYWYDIENPNKPRLICNNPDFENKSIKLIIPDSRNAKSFWIGIQNDGVYGITLNGNCFSVSTLITKELDSESKNIVSIYSDKNANLWVSLADEGLRKISFVNKKIQGSYSIHKIDKKNGLPNLYIQSIFEDFEGNMWFGTFGEGLIEMPLEKFSFNKPEINSDIKAILITKNGTFLNGTTVGLLKYNLQNDKNSVLFNSKNGFVDDAVTSLYEDSDRTIWLGTQNNGIFIYDIQKEKFENFTKKNGLSILSINCITESKDKKLFIGTIEGVYKIDLQTKEINLLTTVEGLLHNNVRHIFCDSKNRAWFSSFRTPCYFLEKNEFTVLQNIESISINSVSEDRKGIIWISTDGDGIYTYDGFNIYNYDVTMGLLSNYCYAAVQSKGNETWITHKNGYSIINNYTKNIKTITKSDGLLFNENNINSTFIDIKNDLWFGTTSGLVKYSVDQANLMKIPPRTTILRLSANDKTFGNNETIILPYDIYTIKINFIGISFIDPSRVLYKYRLSGQDTTWRFTDERVLEFPQIADGNYTFQFYASNRDGVWTQSPCEITFEIKAPFWKKVWFWLLATLVLFIVVFLFIRHRVKGLIKEKQFLESKILEKTYQLQIEKEQLENVKIILEEKSKDITDSINYAKRIQESLLPSKDNLLKNFPKSFVYFMPRDIVSGDFYWFAETEDSFVIAVIDCTGHGIPGAFMSIIGSAILNDIVIDKKITSPGEILNQLNTNIIKSLKQDMEGSSSRDGMDVSICSINKAKTKMLFSSASRPMYYVRNGLLNEVNMRSFSIGGSYKDQEKTYTNNEIELQVDDIFYFFSDGYADQFDYNDGKKFSSKRLKNMFIEIASLSPENQYDTLDSTLKTWKGDKKQIDDITIVGFKI